MKTNSSTAKFNLLNSFKQRYVIFTTIRVLLYLFRFPCILIKSNLNYINNIDRLENPLINLIFQYFFQLTYTIKFACEKHG